MVAWVGLKGMHPPVVHDSHGNATSSFMEAGTAFRALLGFAVLGGLARLVTLKMPDKTRTYATLGAVLVGFLVAPLWRGSGIVYSEHMLNWLQEGSALTMLGGLRGIAANLTILLALIGASLAAGTGKHINIDVLLRFLTPRIRRFVFILSTLATSTVCFTVAWAFLDEISVTEFGADQDSPPGEHVSRVWKSVGNDLFVLRKQMGLDLSAMPHVVAGGQWDDPTRMNGRQWNAFIEDGGFRDHYTKEEVDNLLATPEALEASRIPMVVTPEGSPRGLLLRTMHLMFTIGFGIIGLRFILRMLLVIGGYALGRGRARRVRRRESRRRRGRSARERRGLARLEARNDRERRGGELMGWLTRFKAAGIVLGFLAVLGMPLFAVMGGVSILSWLSSDRPNERFVRHLAANVLDDRFASSPILITIPLFTFAGYLMAESKTPVRLVRASSAALGWMPGGLAIVCIAASAFFTTMTGGSGVTIVAVGGFLYPALVKQGYPKDFSLGLVTSAGAIGLLFPPSPLVMIYSVVAGVDMNYAYLATSVPALGLMVTLAGYAFYVGLKRKVPRAAFDFREVLAALWEVKWELLAPFLVGFGLLSGLMAFEEAAAVAAFYILIVEVYIYRDIRWKDVFRIAKDAISLSGSLIIILAMATAMTNFIIQRGVPQLILDWFINALNVSREHPELEKWKFILALNVFLFIVGMLMDGFSTILVGLPLLLPLAAAFRIHPFHLAVMFLLNMELAYIMPPAGLNLFISSFRFNKPVVKVYRVVIPYVILLHIGLIALIVIPKLSTFSVDKTVAGKRAEAANAKGGPRPPTEAWGFECIQMDRTHPHPCSQEDLALWGPDGTGVHEQEQASNDASSETSTNAKPLEVENMNKDQQDLFAQMMGDGPSPSASASAGPAASAAPGAP